METVRAVFFRTCRIAMALNSLPNIDAVEDMRRRGIFRAIERDAMPVRQGLSHDCQAEQAESSRQFDGASIGEAHSDGVCPRPENSRTLPAPASPLRLRLWKHSEISEQIVVNVRKPEPACSRTRLGYGPESAYWRARLGYGQAQILSTTLPATSVRRKFLPWNRYVNFVCSKPKRFRIVACKSWT